LVSRICVAPFLSPAARDRNENLRHFLDERSLLLRRQHQVAVALALCRFSMECRTPRILERVPVKVRELIKTLEKAGWRHVRTSGDHRVFQSSDGRITVVSGHLGDDIRPGTYRAILRQTGIKESER
jgi:predicted RNA binding protein YcfA (HicA-like mRNA interferase family)